MENENREDLRPVIQDIDENEEENSFFDHAYRETQRKADSCVTGEYTLDEIMAAEGSTALKLLHGAPAGDLKTTTQMRVDEVIRALEQPAEVSEPEEEDLTFEEMVARNEKILAAKNQPYAEPKEPYLTAVISAGWGDPTQQIPVISVPSEAIYTDDSAFIPVEEVWDTEK